MKKTNNISQYPLSNKPLKINPILEQMQQCQAMLDKLPKPNSILEQMQQHQAMLDKLPKSNPILEQMQQHQAMLDKLSKLNPILEQIQQHQAMLDKLHKSNPILKQMQQYQAMLDKLPKPNPIFNKIQQSAQIYEQLYKSDIISSFTSKLKDTEYNDDNLINQIEETKPMVDILKSLPKEFQESLIEEVKLYIDEQVDIKISAKLKEKNSEINSYNTVDPNVSIIFNDAINAISKAFENLCGFYTICPDSMKNDVYLICFLLLMSLFAIPTIYFLYNYYKQK